MTTPAEQEDIQDKDQELHDIIAHLEQREGQQTKRAVLVVDDEPSVRRLVSRSLTSVDPDVEVHEAENGLEALKQFDAICASGTEPALIVTDLQMPVMDGWDFIDKLWEKFESQGRSHGVPLIVLSASSGSKGILFGKTVHGAKCNYHPYATIAKADCIKPQKYDSQGKKGLHTWLKYFLRKFDGA